jgi:hypothetical protein
VTIFEHNDDVIKSCIEEGWNAVKVTNETLKIELQKLLGVEDQ